MDQNPSQMYQNSSKMDQNPLKLMKSIDNDEINQKRQNTLKK